MDENIGQCRGCGADVLWVKLESTDQPHPFDAKPEGRWVFIPGYRKYGDRARMVKTYVSHFATCPDAAKFRREK